MAKHYGTSNGAPPTYYTQEQLSRAHDAVEDLKKFDTSCNTETLRAFWDVLPYALKFELNYARWEYVAKR
jgi:hypothetical protein